MHFRYTVGALDFVYYFIFFKHFQAPKMQFNTIHTSYTNEFLAIDCESVPSHLFNVEVSGEPKFQPNK